MQIPAVARALGSGRRVFSLPLVSFLDSQKLCTYVALQVARFNSVIHLWNSDSSGISALWKLPIFGEALPYKLWVHMAIKGRGCYRRSYHATPTFGGMCLTKLEGPWGKFAGQELPPVIFMGLLLSLLTHTQGAPTQVITLDGCSGVQWCPTYRITSKDRDITPGDHLHPDSACSHQTWGSTNL